MKKITFFLVAVVAMIASAADAQKKDDLYAGGIIKFGLHSAGSNGHMGTSCSFAVEPEVGLFLIDNLKVGGKISYEYASSSHNFRVMPNVAYYLPIVDKFYYTPQFAIGGGFAAYNGVDGVDGIFTMSFNLASFEYKPIENLGISLDLINLDYNLINRVNVVNFGLFTSPSVGVRYYF